MKSGAYDLHPHNVPACMLQLMGTLRQWRRVFQIYKISPVYFHNSMSKTQKSA